MTKVYSISDYKISTIKDFNHTIFSGVDKDAELENERAYYPQKAKDRAEKFKIILGNSPLRLPLTKFCSYISGSIVVSVGSTFFCSLIPAHNLLTHPDFWFEMLVPALPWSILNGVYFSFVASSYMNINYIKKIRYILLLCALGCILAILIIVSAHSLWTYGIGFQIPLPFTGYAVAYVILVSTMPAQWFIFPREWRKNRFFRKRLKFLMLNYVSGLVIPVIYNMLAKMLLTVSIEYQPIVAFGFPLLEKITSWICNKWVRKL